MPNRHPRCLPLLALVLAAGAQADHNGHGGQDSDSLHAAIFHGEMGASFRLRYENASAELPGRNDNHALTLRSRVFYTSAPFHGLQAGIELEDITSVGDQDYNDANNGEPGPAIADDSETEVNQAWIGWQFRDARIAYGRQRINYDNQRHVGGVGFRQNEQTFDGLTFRYTGFAGYRLQLAQINNVNRIFGDDDPKGDHEGDSYLLNLSYSGSKLLNLTTYAYWLDNHDAPAFSTDTYGVRLHGMHERYGANPFYTLEYATQRDSDANPAEYRAEYYLAEGGLEFDTVTALVGHEVLGAETDGAFITPLGTLHKFQGWADVFLGGGSGNIVTGIRDSYAQVSGRLGGFRLKAVWHEFDADQPTAALEELGQEWDFSVALEIQPRLTVSFELADYDAEDFGVDTRRYWTTLSFSF